MKKNYTQLVKGVLLTLLSLGLVSNPVAWAQSIPDAQWARLGLTLSVTTDGNIVTTDAFPKVAKYDLQGNKIFETGALAGTSYLAGKLPINCPCVGGYAYIASIGLTAPTTDGGIVLEGSEYGSSFPIFTSVDASGQQGGRNNNPANDDLIGTPDGGALLLNNSTNLDGSHVLTVQKSGVWTKQIAYPDPNLPTPNNSLTKGEAVINTPDGGFLVVGYYNATGDEKDLNNFNSLGASGWVAKLDGNGNVVWQKLLNNLPMAGGPNGIAPGSLLEFLAVTDVTLAADGNGYALAGLGLIPSAMAVAPPVSAILELDWNGNFKRARSLGFAGTKTFITPYTDPDGTKYYAVGNTSKENGADPRIIKVSTATLALNDPNLLKVIAQRTFDGPSDGFLTDIATAGDGSIVFVTTAIQLVKLNAETAPQPISNFTLLAPTYNCQTGAITFNTSGGNGTPITYSAPGIARASATDNFGIVEQGLRNDPKVIQITATQSGVSVVYNFDLKAACSNQNPNPSTPQPPILNQPIPDQFLTVGQSVPGSGFPVGLYFTDPTVNVPNYMSNWAFNITGLPDGLYPFSRPNDLQFTPAIIILGTPTTVGVYTVTVTASTGAFRSSPVITTFKITVSNTSQPGGGTLTVTKPTYNCQTGAIHFNTSGGDSSPIEFQAPGITSWTTNPDHILDQCARTCADIAPFMISARQNGQVVSYSWSRQNHCANPSNPVSVGTIPDLTVAVGQGVYFPIGTYFSSSLTTNWGVNASNLPPGVSTFFRQEGGGSTIPTWVLVGTANTAGVYIVTASASANGGAASTTFKFTVTGDSNPPNPPTGPLTLLAPTYDCGTGAIHFNTSGGNSTPIEFQAIGITGWTTNPDQFVDKDSRTANDVQPFTLMARQNGQVVTYVWNLKEACGRARIGAEESTAVLQVRALGNPIEGKSAEIEISGASGQAVQLDLVDIQGRMLHQHHIDQAGLLERVSVPIGNGKGLLLLNVSTSSQRQQVKLLKP
jgi:hypothetical protein